MPDFPIGHQIGNYVIEAEVGRGRIGALYRARHATMAQVVAVRRIDHPAVKDPAVRERLIGEYRILDRLRPEFVVAVYDLHVHEDELFVVMELVEGESLASRIQSGGPMPIAEVVDLVEQVLKGLNTAHRAGLVHGSLSPQEIWLTPTGARVLDLGLAPVRGLPGDEEAVGPMPATRFVAPEAWTSRPEATADVHGLGLCLYVALTGELPPEVGQPGGLGEVPDVRILRPDTPGWLAAVVFHSTRRDPAARYANAGDLRMVVRSREPADEDPSSFVMPDQPEPIEALALATDEVESTQVSAGQFPGMGHAETLLYEDTPAQGIDPEAPEATQFVPHEVTPVESADDLLQEATPAAPLPDPSEWALDNPTKVEAAPDAPEAHDDWELEAKTKVEPAPAPAPPARPAPAPAPSRRSPLAGCGILFGLGGLVLAMLICAVGAGLTDWSAIQQLVMGSGASDAPTITVQPQDDGTDVPAEDGGGDDGADDGADDAAGGEEAVEDDGEEDGDSDGEEGADTPDSTEDDTTTSSGSSSGSSSSGSSSGRSSGSSSSGSSSSGRSSGSSGSSSGSSGSSGSGTTTADPATTTGPTSGSSGGTADEDEQELARLVVMATANRRKKLKDLVVVVDERPMGNPPVTMDVRPGTHMIEWKGDGFVEICPVEVGPSGRTVKMNLDDPSCP